MTNAVAPASPPVALPVTHAAAGNPTRPASAMSSARQPIGGILPAGPPMTPPGSASGRSVATSYPFVGTSPQEPPAPRAPDGEGPSPGVAATTVAAAPQQPSASPQPPSVAMTATGFMSPPPPPQQSVPPPSPALTQPPVTARPIPVAPVSLSAAVAPVVPVDAALEDEGEEEEEGSPPMSSGPVHPAIPDASRPMVRPTRRPRELRSRLDGESPQPALLELSGRLDATDADFRGTVAGHESRIAAQESSTGALRQELQAARQEIAQLRTELQNVRTTQNAAVAQFEGLIKVLWYRQLYTGYKLAAFEGWLTGIVASYPLPVSVRTQVDEVVEKNDKETARWSDLADQEAADLLRHNLPLYDPPDMIAELRERFLIPPPPAS